MKTHYSYIKTINQAHLHFSRIPNCRPQPFLRAKPSLLSNSFVYTQTHNLHYPECNYKIVESILLSICS